MFYRYPRPRSESGFTLIEVMVVIAIIAGVLVVGAPKMFSTATAMRGAIRKIAVMTRDIRNNSRLYGVTTRLVINIAKDKSGSYSVESSPGIVLMTTQVQADEIEKLTSSQSEDSKPKTKFTAEGRVLKKTIALPAGLMFLDVEKTGRDDAVIEGKAYINFYPQGLSEEAAIHIGDGKSLNWTIVINPLTGRADVYEKHVTLKELKNL